MTVRWSVEQIESIAPSAASMSAARPVAAPARWRATGADERSLWGSYHGSGAEPYETIVDHATVGFRCTCPSRRSPCKHSLALLLLWVGGHVVDTVAPPAVVTWMSHRRPMPSASGGSVPDTPTQTPERTQTPGSGAAPPDRVRDDEHERNEPERTGERNEARDRRVAKMRDGLDDLDRWLVDRMRTGLADPSLAQYATWDALAARLVDAGAGSLANRVRRLAGLVGASPDWHERVLEEVGLLHLLAQAGRRFGMLAEPSSASTASRFGPLADSLADRVATTIGWQVRQADVLAGVPDTDDWVIAGRSDTREDRIEVRRHWLRGSASGRWALVLSFAAYRQSLDDSLEVGTSIRADLHRYPGGALRALVGERFGEPVDAGRFADATVAEACDEIGALLVGEPWLDRAPAVLAAAPSRSRSGWVLTDSTGSIPLVVAPDGMHGLDILLAVSAGAPVDVSVEWTPMGVVVLAVRDSHRWIDIGPRAEASFVGAA